MVRPQFDLGSISKPLNLSLLRFNERSRSENPKSAYSSSSSSKMLFTQKKKKITDHNKLELFYGYIKIS